MATDDIFDLGTGASQTDSSSGRTTDTGDTSTESPVGTEGGRAESGHEVEQLDRGTEHDRAVEAFESLNREQTATGDHNQADTSDHDQPDPANKPDPTDQPDPANKTDPPNKPDPTDHPDPTNKTNPSDQSGPPDQPDPANNTDPSDQSDPPNNPPPDPPGPPDPPEKPDPHGGLHPGTSDAATYPEEKKDAETTPVGSDHPAVAAAKLPGRGDEFQQQSRDTADAMARMDDPSDQAGPGGKTSTEQVAKDKEQQDTPVMDLLLLLPLGYTLGRTWHEQRRSHKGRDDK